MRVSEAIPIPGLELNHSQQTSELLPQAVCDCPTPSPAETGETRFLLHIHKVWAAFNTT